MPRIPSFSYSRLTCLEKCEHQYVTRYVKRVYLKTNSVESFVGVLIHEIIEKAAERGHLELLPAWEYLSERWEKEFNPRVHYDVRQLGEDHWKDHAMRCVKNYLTGSLVPPDWETIGLEYRMSYGLLDDPPAKFTGIVDRLIRRNGAYKVEDFKTGKPQPRKYFERDQQLPLYAYLVARAFAVPENETIEVNRHYLSSGEIQPLFVTSERRNAAWRWAQETAQKARKLEAAAKAEQTRGKPHRSPLCDWCDYKKEHCDAWRKSTSTDPL